jgi:hypothetical protein
MHALAGAHVASIAISDLVPAGATAPYNKLLFAPFHTELSREDRYK